MSEIAIRPHEGNYAAVAVPQPGQDQAIARLAEWARAADAAYQVANRLVSTKFAPVQYRGKPDEATAAILAGAEVGLSPTAALRAFDDIQGTPAPKAVTLRAIVQAQGHDVRIDESTPERAAVSARRKGDTQWQTSTWTIDRARAMGLLGKDQWKKQPGAMLVARATAEVCRWVASDAIMGMPYTSEEIRDEGPGFEGRPEPRRVTAAEILDQDPTPAADPAPAAETPARSTAAQLIGLVRMATSLDALKRLEPAALAVPIDDPDLESLRVEWVRRTAHLKTAAQAATPVVDETGGADPDSDESWPETAEPSDAGQVQ